LSTLYIRLPSKAAAEAAEHWMALPCPFALATPANVVEREGVAPLSDLTSAVAAAQRVVLVVAASDVTLLHVKTPPLSAAKLKLVLPNLVEDQLMADPDECVVVPGNMVDGLRTAAVMQRGWLDILSKSFTSFGARSLTAVPAQLCLPYREGNAAATIAELGVDIDLALRNAEQSGIGLPIMPESADAAVAEVLATLRTLAPAMPITLYVPQSRVLEYQEAIGESSGEFAITVHVDQWSHWVDGASKAALNLMSGLGAGSGPQVNWRQWRWAVVLASLLLLVNALGLNLDWWNMKREATALRTAMIQTFKSTYPKEAVILDPIAQMHKKIDEAERSAGRAAPDDFVQIAANFAEALDSELAAAKAQGTASSVVASIEYHERGLLVHIKPDNKVSQEKMKIALAARNLSLTNPSNGVWQIGSAK
jgi:general secretion pathway protein L